MEAITKKKKVVRAKSNKFGKKQVITKKGNATQKNANGPKAGKKENLNAPTKETNKKPVLPPTLNSIKPVKAGPKRIETNTKRGKFPKSKKLPGLVNPGLVNPTKTASNKIQTKTYALTQVDEKKPIVVIHNKAPRGIRKLATVLPPKNEEYQKPCKITSKTASKNNVNKNNMVPRRGAPMSDSKKSSKPRLDFEKTEKNDKLKKESHETKSKTGKSGDGLKKSKKMELTKLKDKKYLALRTGYFGKKSPTPKFDVLAEAHEASPVEQNNNIQIDLMSENYDNSENKILMGRTTHVNNSVHAIKLYKNFNPVKLSDEENPKEGDHKEKFEDYQIQTENLYFGKNNDMDSKPFFENIGNSEDAFKLAMTDKILLTLLRNQLDASSSDGSTTAELSSSSNPGVLIWEVQSLGKIDGNQCKTEEKSKPHNEDETPVGYEAQDEFSFKKEILEELMTAFDNSPDIVKRSLLANEDVITVKDQETSEERTNSRVSGPEDDQNQDNSPMENTFSDNNCGDNTKDVKLSDDSEKCENKTSPYAAEMDNVFVDVVNEVFKEHENEFKEGDDEIAEEEFSTATSSKDESYQCLLKFPTISPSAVDYQNEDENEKEYLVRLKSNMESTPSGGIHAMSKYFIDVLSLNKYLRYFNRSQVFKE